MNVVAFEDGSFRVGEKGEAFLLGVLTDGFRLVDVSVSLVEVNGFDATGRLLDMAEAWKGRFSLVMLSSLAYAGFNVVDPEEVCRRLGTPVIVVLPRKPRRRAVERALKRHFSDWERRLKVLGKVGEPVELRLPGGRVYVSAFGLTAGEALEAVRRLTVFGGRPEPLRMADLLVKGLGLWKGVRGL
ncbi:MAG: endonuclease dU [Candidatus Hecatellaceae archaeon]